MMVVVENAVGDKYVTELEKKVLKVTVRYHLNILHMDILVQTRIPGKEKSCDNVAVSIAINLPGNKNLWNGILQKGGVSDAHHGPCQRKRHHAIHH